MVGTKCRGFSSCLPLLIVELIALLVSSASVVALLILSVTRVLNVDSQLPSMTESIGQAQSRLVSPPLSYSPPTHETLEVTPTPIWPHFLSTMHPAPIMIQH